MIEGIEECDDGNTYQYDACDSVCRLNTAPWHYLGERRELGDWRKFTQRLGPDQEGTSDDLVTLTLDQRSRVSLRKNPGMKFGWYGGGCPTLLVVASGRESTAYTWSAELDPRGATAQITDAFRGDYRTGCDDTLTFEDVPAGRYYIRSSVSTDTPAGLILDYRGYARVTMEVEITPLGGPICGDGVLDDSEECDDGNQQDGDNCSSVCTLERIQEHGIPDPQQLPALDQMLVVGSLGGGDRVDRYILSLAEPRAVAVAMTEVGRPCEFDAQLVLGDVENEIDGADFCPDLSPVRDAGLRMLPAGEHTLEVLLRPDGNGHAGQYELNIRVGPPCDSAETCAGL